MSAEVLREAARLMRERAEAATPGVWTHAGWGDVVTGYEKPASDDPLSSYYSDGGVAEATDPEGDDDQTTDNAEHIASWHPAVALAVADWLDYQARTIEHNVSEGARPPGCHPDHPALAVARAYLGDPS